MLFKGRGVNSEGKQTGGDLLLIDKDRKSVHSIFEETTEAKMERDLDAILANEKYQKKYKPEKFKIEKETDRKGRPVTK